MPGFWKSVGNFFTGTPEKHKRVSTLLPEQQGNFNQLNNAIQGQGAGGAFGDAADYYRDLLDVNGTNAQQQSAPYLRQFNEQMIPDLAEQFAGMGSGGLSSSGFRNAGISAGTDLSERLGALRSQLRQQGAAGLANLGGMGLQNYSQDVMTQPGSQGFLSQAAPAFGTAIGAAFGGPAGAAIGGGIGNMFGGGSRSGSQAMRNSGPYGQNGPQASPQFQLPNRSF